LKQKTTKSLFLQKQRRYSHLQGLSRGVLFSACGILLVWVLSSFYVVRVKTITFTAADSLEITADEYITDPEFPYILLLHEQGSSRGEFHTIARRLCKLDYNCLAVDLRNGGNNSHVSNETARRCRESRCPAGVESLGMDVAAAIEYIQEKSDLPVILFGSGANGSLSLKIAAENEHVRAVVALSPGEYFMPALKIQDSIEGLKKPVFITASKAEIPYISELASGIGEDYLTLFEPKLGEGNRGTESLSEKNENNTEYWVALILFFGDLM
jgi:pimeloyl-ACP methyl ester carboxylesterase